MIPYKKNIFNNRMIICSFIICIGCASAKTPIFFSGFKPTQPEMKYTEKKAPEIDTYFPILEWEEFPGAQQPHTDGTTKNFLDLDLARTQNVTYEIRIWPKEGFSWGNTIYEKKGLVEPRHRLEVPLKPGTEYLWTVRARFEFDGNTRVSKWSKIVTKIPPGLSKIQFIRSFVQGYGLPPWVLYRFKTPGEQIKDKKELDKREVEEDCDPGMESCD
jgi:hypothetical protein